jgi:hypothetical protein
MVANDHEDAITAAAIVRCFMPRSDHDQDIAHDTDRDAFEAALRARLCNAIALTPCMIADAETTARWAQICTRIGALIRPEIRRYMGHCRCGQDAVSKRNVARIGR